MISAVARKEIAQNLSSLKFWVAALLTAALAVLALLASAKSYQARRQVWQERLDTEHEVLKKVHTYSYLRPLAFRAPAPLSIIDQGFDARLGAALQISPFVIPRSAQEEPLGNEFLATWPTVDVTAIVGILLSFVALLLTCGIFVGERERGTLRLLAVTGVTPRKLLVGKYLGALGSVSSLLVLVSAIGFGFLRVYAGQDLAPHHYVRLVEIFAAYLSYLSLIILVGLILSLLSPSSSRALVQATAGWLLLILVVPDLASSLANDLHPVRDLRWRAQTLEDEILKTRHQQSPMTNYLFPLLRRFSSETPIYHYSEDYEQSIFVRFGSARYYRELVSSYAHFIAVGRQDAIQIEAAHRPGDMALREAQRLALIWGAVSPRTLLDETVHSLAGTSVSDHDRFLAHCRRYRRRIIQYMEEKDAFRSWRWVTDDRPDALFPWPSFFGLTVDRMNQLDLRYWFSLLGKPPYDVALHRRVDMMDHDPTRALQLADLPRFSFRDLDFVAALQRTRASFFGLAFLNLSVAVIAWKLAEARACES